MKIQKLKSKHIIIICFILLVCIFAYLSVLSTKVSWISVDEFSSKVKTAKSIKNSYVLDGNLYTSIDGKKYALMMSDEVAKASLNIPLEQKMSESYVEYMLLFVAMAFFGFIVVMYIKQNKDRQEFLKNANKSQDINPKIKIETPTLNVRFDDIAGLDNVKKELIRLCDMIKNPQKYKSLNIKLPKGVLLCGPSGVGKTYIAKALANESGAKFFYHSAASFNELYIGVGAKKIRELFAIAKNNAPSIIFIDEIDAIGKIRGSVHASESESTLNELLTQMDGFVGNDNVIVIAATNKYEVLDMALTRSGRFDKKIFLELPDFNARLKLYELYFGDRLDINHLARLSEGFSGADIATFANEFALLCIEKNNANIDDAIELLNKIKFGHKTLPMLDKKELLVQSLYQSSKAYMAYVLGQDFDRVSLWEIVYESKDKAIYSKSDLVAKIKILLSGKAANFVFFDDEFDNFEKDYKEILKLVKKLENMGVKGFDLNACFEEIKPYVQNEKTNIEKLAQILSTKDISKNDLKAIFNF